ncbi:MAG: oligoendopeptidase F [Sedimentisphaerales bacterium]|nr:oligoendopeptidase F [Sedimentisphaerales bacterium]
MKRLASVLILMSLLIAFSQTPASAQTRQRSEIAPQDTWNLQDLYESDQAWEQAKNDVTAQFDQVLNFQGKLTTSADQLLACLELNSKISREFGRLSSYASMKSDLDLRVSKNLAMKQQLEQLSTDFSSKASFIGPELARLDKPTIDRFIAEKPALKPYKMTLYDILRTKKHLLSEKEEKIIALTGLLSDGPYSIFSVFSNAELPYPEITLSDGTAATLDKAGYARYRVLQNRSDRDAVFQAFWKSFEKFKGTFGTQLYAQVKKDMFYAHARNYNSSLESALDKNNIPTDVYLQLIENVHNNLDSFHRYLKIKKRMLAVDTLKYSDLYAPVVKDVDLKFTYAQARDLVLDAVKPLGPDYVRVIDQAFKNRWIDVYPTPGKRAGAYSNGSAYDVHPYILLNYNDTYEDVSTLAHELGHTMHSYYSNKTQPFPTADYSIFVAEVASTFNEALLIDKMLREIKDDDTRLSLLMNYLDGLKGTVFRQAQFAEFELRIHELAESGQPLTGDVLTEEYGKILKTYYGHDQHVCYIDDLYTVEWAYIPHFYYNFYVYQYSTSFTASTALAEKVLAHEPGAVENYLKFISAGGSDYPIQILKNAGVDMTTPDPFQKTMTAMNRTMDEIEAILNKKAQN